MNEKLNLFLTSKPIKFLQGGVGLKVISFSLNYILADLLSLDIELSYVFVLVCDFLAGYLINRHFVFSDTKAESDKSVFIKFIIAGVGFRILNWLIYIVILKQLDIYILLAQLIATGIVLVLKFTVYKKIFK